MNKALQSLLKALSEPETDMNLRKTRHLMNLKAVDPFKRFYRTIDYKIYNGDHEVPTRIYFPNEESFEMIDIEAYHKRNSHTNMNKMEDNTYPVLLFFHGGGFVTESVKTYNRICWNMARLTNHVVVSVDYRLAPEYRFPIPFNDCYAAAKAIFTDRTILQVNPEDITIIGDSAGANLAACVCQMSRDRKEFFPERQILIYPCTNNEYGDDCPFDSVRENGQGYLLTQKNLQDYMKLYQRNSEDIDNPYFAPLKAKDFSGLPESLVITAEFDPLRDEGEAYANRMKEAGVDVTLHRIKDAVHGFFLLPQQYPAVKETYEYINLFLKEVNDRVSVQKNEVEKSGEYSKNISCHQQ